MEEINKHQEAEKVGRDLFLDFFGDRFKIEMTTDEFNRTDLRLTGMTDGLTYVGDVKAYRDPEHPRPMEKWGNYLIDRDKCWAQVDKGAKEGSIPFICSFYDDCTAIWDLRYTNWSGHTGWTNTNADGQNYGAKQTPTLASYLFFCEIEHLLPANPEYTQEELEEIWERYELCGYRPHKRSVNSDFNKYKNIM